MTIVVVGSVALDSVETPFGKAVEALGGSATYFSLAARHFHPVQLVGVVGGDFPAAHVDLLAKSGVDLTGLTVEEGLTFRWAGRYDLNLNDCKTLDTQLNVFATFRPSLPEAYRDAGVVFLANIDPSLQLEVLKQVRRPWLTAMDTMNFWISGQRDRVAEVIRSVDVVIVNEAELRQFAGTPSLHAAARQVLSLGPKALVVKKGEYGAAVYGDDLYFVVPAYPLDEVKDPTGAGDSFAGGFLGYLARAGQLSPPTLRRALVYGSVVASFTVEDFSVRRLVRLTPEEIAERYRDFREFTEFGEDIQ
jgi:sugar/nucleoside kinase (ribokinase family)